jgi:hypothetical protein
VIELSLQVYLTGLNRRLEFIEELGIRKTVAYYAPDLKAMGLTYVQMEIAAYDAWREVVIYPAYLTTTWWASVRAGALERAGGRCQVCNADGPILDVHHRTYERLGQERDSDLTVLCRGCHELFHANGRLEHAHV